MRLSHDVTRMVQEFWQQAVRCFGFSFSNHQISFLSLSLTLSHTHTIYKLKHMGQTSSPPPGTPTPLSLSLFLLHTHSLSLSFSSTFSILSHKIFVQVTFKMSTCARNWSPQKNPQVRIWNFPARVTYFTPLKGLYFWKKKQWKKFRVLHIE